jgi:hypothetical protein
MAKDAAASRDVPSAELAGIGARRSKATLSVDASGIARWFSDYGSVLFGASAGVHLGDFSLHAEGLAASHTTELGGTSFAIVAGTASFMVWQWATPRVRFALGPAGALGATWATGSARRDGIVVDDRVAPYADLRLIAQVGISLRSVGLMGALEGGRAAGLASSAGTEIAGATGGWFVGASIGAGYRLSPGAKTLAIASPHSR